MYKIAVLNGRLLPSELSIMYGQLGGDACFPLQFDTPDLLCQRCHKPLVLLLQHVSPASTAAIHRVTYVFICNSTHCIDTGLALTVNIPYCWKKKAEKINSLPQNSPALHQPLLVDTGETPADLLSTLKEASLSNSSAPQHTSSVVSSTTEQDSIPYRKICSPLPAFDLRSYPVEQERIQLALGETKQIKATGDDEDNDEVNEGIDGTPMEVLQWHHPKAMVLYGYDVPPLLPPSDKQVMSQVDSTRYVHECDIFPTVISALQLYSHGISVEDSAEFRMISVWGARTMEPGVHPGYVHVVPEEELGDYFNPK